jgi:hypothetical protein
VLHGAYTYLLQDADGQVADTHSISAGLDYAAVGPEHTYLREIGRAEYTYADDAQALAAFSAWRTAKASCRRSNLRTRWLKPSAWRRRCAPTRFCWSTCLAAAIKTWIRHQSAKTLITG